MKKFAVFDIDGTLIRWQLYHAVVDKLAKQGALGKQAHSQVTKARMEWKNRQGIDSFKKYEGVLINVYEAAIQNLQTELFDKLVLEVIDEYKDQAYVYTRQLISELKTKSYMLLAISGSHAELIEQIAEYYGFDDYIATNYERIDGKFSGSKKLGSHAKNEALNSLIKKYDLTLEDSLAIGDSASDIPMLDMVKQPIAFNPENELFQYAKNQGWQIVLERKNVIYKLYKDNDKYILA